MTETQTINLKWKIIKIYIYLAVISTTHNIAAVFLQCVYSDFSIEAQRYLHKIDLPLSLKE